MFKSLTWKVCAALCFPILLIASLPFAITACALLDTLRPSITAAGHILLNGLDELLSQLEEPSTDRAAAADLTQEIVEAFSLCAETVPKRYLEPYRTRFRAATRNTPIPEGARTTPPG